MGCELTEREASTTPKLSLSSLPRQPREPPGLLTPPLQAPASIPFRWEEAPGIPRECDMAPPKPRAARCLELPPRLLAAEVRNKVSSMASPTMVLAGPQIGRSLSFLSFSFGRREGCREQSRSWRWSSHSSSIENREAKGRSSPDYLSSSSMFGKGEADKSVNNGSSGGDGCGGNGEMVVKITRMRKTSLQSLSERRSPLWTNIYESFKQVVPWRRKLGKLKKKDASSAPVP